jgi:hypothetical protein
MEGPGAFWLAGTFETGGGVQDLEVRVDDSSWLFSSRDALIGRVVLTPAGGRNRMIPFPAACAHYVDWYRTG